MGDKKGSKPKNSFKEAKEEAKALGLHQKLEERVKASLILKTRKTPGVLRNVVQVVAGCWSPGSDQTGLIYCLRELSSQPLLETEGSYSGPPAWPRGGSRNKTVNNTKPKTLSIYFIKKFLCINFLKTLKLKLDPTHPCTKK